MPVFCMASLLTDKSWGSLTWDGDTAVAEEEVQVAHISQAAIRIAATENWTVPAEISAGDLNSRKRGNHKCTAMVAPRQLPPNPTPSSRVELLSTHTIHPTHFLPPVL